MESSIDSYVFHSGPLPSTLLSPGINELWMRTAVIGLILAFSLYAYLTVLRHKRLEDLCRVSEHTQQSLLDATTDGAMLLSRDGTIDALNTKAAEGLGASATDLIGKRVYDLMTPEAVSRRRLRERMVIENGRPLHFEDERDGRWFDINIYPMFNGTGEVVRWAVFDREITEFKKMEQELRRLSITDDLTGLLNQRHFMERVRQEVERAGRVGYPLCLAILDVDDFKRYNDTYGHLRGNEILRKIGDIIRRSIRKNVDSAYRFGGDEFAVILPYAEKDKAEGIIERIGTRTARDLSGVTISAGISVFSEGTTVHHLIQAADKSMYGDKNRGRTTRGTGRRRGDA
jgi:diguanylate cyclase (GGDEF)-like protein/PAS domain S-box-containing protein